MRLIAAVRVSHLAETSTSPETQTERLEDYARRHGHTIVAVTEDLDVSGGMPIRQRPGVGKWLTKEHLHEWDALAGYAIDRMFRNHYDFITFWYEFMKPNGKKLISVSENIDMSTDEGEMMANMRVMFAQSERRKISERVTRGREKRIRQKRWSGGRVPYGYKPVCLCHGLPRWPEKGEKTCEVPSGWKLVKDGEWADLMVEVANRLLGRPPFERPEPASRICQDLTKRGIPTGLTRRATSEKTKAKYANTSWNTSVLIGMMSNPVLKGVQVRRVRVNPDGTPVKGRIEPTPVIDPATGKDLRFTDDPILDDDTWDALQLRLKSNRQKWGGGTNRNRKDTGMVSGIAKCPCGIKIYSDRIKDRPYDYYKTDDTDRARVARCHHRSMRMDEVDKIVDEWMYRHSYVIKERVEVRQEDENARLLSEIRASIGRLGMEFAEQRISLEEYQDRQAKLNAQLSNVGPIKELGPRYDYRPTTETSASRWRKWSNMGAAGVERKHQFLAEMGFTIMAFKSTDEFGIVENEAEWRADPEHVKPIIVKCPGCGKPATTARGTCTSKSIKVGQPGYKCYQAYNNRGHQNRMARKCGQPIPWNYDVDRIEVIVRPGFLYEADWFGIQVQSRETYNMRMLAAYRRGEVEFQYKGTAAIARKVWKLHEDDMWAELERQDEEKLREMREKMTFDELREEMQRVSDIPMMSPLADE